MSQNDGQNTSGSANKSTFFCARIKNYENKNANNQSALILSLSEQGNYIKNAN
jgi:hypothetical protein